MSWCQWRLSPPCYYTCRVDDVWHWILVDGLDFDLATCLKGPAYSIQSRCIVTWLISVCCRACLSCWSLHCEKRTLRYLLLFLTTKWCSFCHATATMRQFHQFRQNMYSLLLFHHIYIFLYGKILCIFHHHSWAFERFRHVWVGC